MDGIVIKDTGGPKKFYGISKEAKRLGVSRYHLWKVLNGFRESARIMREVRIKDAGNLKLKTGNQTAGEKA